MEQHNNPALPDQSSFRVLTIEDDPDIVRLVGTALRRQENPRFEVRSARTLAEGLRLLGEATFDAAVLDLGLPDSRGAATVEAVRARFPILPIVVLSATCEEDTIHAAMRANAQDYILKGPAVIHLLPRAILFAVERRRAEQALEESEARYRSLVTSSLDAVLLTVPDGRILSANEAACLMFGYAEPELIQLGRNGIIDSSDARLAPAMEERARTGRFRGELTLVRKNGTKFPAEIASAVFIDQHGEQRTSMVIRDITERKRAEEQIRMFSRKLLAAQEEEKKRVSAVLHHDVGSLAVGMSTCLAAMEEDIRSGKTGAALKAAKAAGKLFEQSVARLKGLAVELRPPDLDILGLRAAMRQHFSRIMERGRIRIRFTENLGRRRLSDDTATVLFRVGQEALTNAITHGHAKKADVSLRVSGQTVRLTLRDNGKGFNPSEPGTQKAWALGLRVMQDMATSAGGSFEIDSAPGKGTTVRVSLPLKTR